MDYKLILKEALEKIYKCDISNALVEKIFNDIDGLIDSPEVEVCENCGKVFLKDEQALQYEQCDGSYTCDCLSPESQMGNMADDDWKMRDI